jgi:hypothetical protein
VWCILVYRQCQPGPGQPDPDCRQSAERHGNNPSTAERYANWNMDSNGDAPRRDYCHRTGQQDTHAYTNFKAYYRGSASNAAPNSSASVGRIVWGIIGR